MLKKIAKDLGEMNIPKTLIQQVIPGELRAMYWREESVSPENFVVEIWGSNESTFYVIAGDFASGQWSQEFINLVGEYETVDQAIAAARSSYVIKDNEQPVAQASNTFKRLIKKN